MFTQNSKYMLIYLILALLLFAFESVYCFCKYAVDIDKGMSLIGGIIFGLMSIFQVDEMYSFIKNKKSGKLNIAVKSTSE
jgi:hypothetical protein